MTISKRSLVSGVLALSIGALSLWQGTQHNQLFSTSNTRYVDRSSIPEIVKKELWIGDEKKGKVELTVDGDTYYNLLSTPRSRSSEYDVKRFGKPQETLDELAQLIINAGYENFTSILSGPTNNPDQAVFYPSFVSTSDYMRILSFIDTNVTYQSDPGSGYAQFPLETLISGTGDCEDAAYLATALFSKVRETGVVFEKVNGVGHATVAIQLNDGEELPYRIIYDTTVFAETLNEVNSSSALPKDLQTLDDIYAYMFSTYPNLVVKKESPATITHNDKVYFLVETTGTVYNFRTNSDLLGFHPNNFFKE